MSRSPSPSTSARRASAVMSWRNGGGRGQLALPSTNTPSAVVEEQLLGPEVGDDRVEIAVAVDVAEVGFRAVGDGRRQVRRADVGEHAVPSLSSSRLGRGAALSVPSAMNRSRSPSLSTSTRSTSVVDVPGSVASGGSLDVSSTRMKFWPRPRSCARVTVEHINSTTVP